MNPLNLYLLQDGTHANPSDVAPDKKGVLRHKNGLAVALYEDGTPQTVGKDAVVNKNVEAAKTGDEAIAAKQQTVWPPPSYTPHDIKIGEPKPHTSSGVSHAPDIMKVGEPHKVII